MEEEKVKIGLFSASYIVIMEPSLCEIYNGISSKFISLKAFSYELNVFWAKSFKLSFIMAAFSLSRIPSLLQSWEDNVIEIS
jgi:hypothetical protein